MVGKIQEVFMTSSPNTNSQLREYLKGKSFQIGLEDFGTKKSNYFYLSYEAIDELLALFTAEHNRKLDELLAIVDNLNACNPKDAPLTKHIHADQVREAINKAKALNLKGGTDD